MKNIQTIYLDLDIYSARIIFTSDKESYEKEVKRLKQFIFPKFSNIGNNNLITAKASIANNLHILIYANVKEIIKVVPVYEVYALLAHEASHVFDFVMEDIKEEAPGCEIKAYHIQYITSFLIKESMRILKYGSKKR